METSCHLDGTLFPFDSQSCSIIVQSWAYSEAFVDLRNASSFVHLDGFNDDSMLAVSFDFFFFFVLFVNSLFVNDVAYNFSGGARI